MGEPNAALGVYMNDPARIRSVLEYYLGEKLPEDWKYEQLKGMYSVRDSKGRQSEAGSEPDVVLGKEKVGEAAVSLRDDR
ncbi:MAG: hypothetical protein K2J60_13375 [Acetatifactor sp.]|nr:hypothetical protein [Acetatifactor sp.]